MSTKIYSIAIPVVASGTCAFSFSTTVNALSWGFSFIYMNSRWTCYATPPANANSDLALVREATVYANNLNWLGYPDYGCFFYSSIPEPKLNDIASVGMYIMDWTK
jgi:hypothetical protein